MPSSRRAWWHRRSLAFALASMSGPAFAGPSSAKPEAPTSPPLAPPTDAAEPPLAERVIVVARMPGDDGVLLRLRAELRETDWLVVEVPFDEDAPRPPLAQLAERERASAAVRVEARRGTIELWVARPEGAVEEALDASGEPLRESVLALRVVEALRARGLRIEKRTDEVAPPPEHPPALVAPKPVAVPKAAVPKEAPRDGARLWLELGPTLLVSPGGLAPEPELEVLLSLELGKSVSFGLGARIPIAARTLTGPEGEADIATWTAGGTLSLEWGRSAFGSFRSGIAAGAAVTTMSGNAAGGFTGATDTVTTFAPEARASYVVHLSPLFELGVGGAVGVAIPRVEIAFGAREAAVWGLPFVALGLTLNTNVASF